MTTEPESLHRQLGLTDEEFEEIKAILGRKPNQVELAMYSVMWSEHCSYKSSRLHLSRLPSEAPWVVVGPGENAGVVEIDGDFVAVLRIESHNHPSAVEPFQGAATGVGGIIRDVLSMGARPLVLGDPLRFGPLQPKDRGPAATSPEEAARNRYLFRRVVAGISHYGNAVGVPTIGGELSFAPCYSANPLVNVFCLGIARKKDLMLARATRPGDLVVLLGSSTGRDGIGGVSILASAGFDEKASEKRPSVQVGDPFEEKKLIEACLEIFRNGLATAVQDLGGAGLSCASSEMAARGGTGIELDVSKVHRREPGMSPAEVMVSESQERMFLVVPPTKLDAVLGIARKWGIQASVVGKVTDGKDLVVRDRSTPVAEVPANSLADGPLLDRPKTKPGRIEELEKDSVPPIATKVSPEECLLQLLATPGIGDSSWVWQQYDHQLFLNTLIGPGSDAAVIRARIPDEFVGRSPEGRIAMPGTDMPGEDSFLALAIAFEGGGRFCFLDPRTGAEMVVAEVTRKLACHGAKPLAIVDCLNFGNPEHPEVMWEFSETIDGIAHAATSLGVPVIGGNVSFYNETNGVDIWPTPILAAVGVDGRADRIPVRMGFPGENLTIAVLGAPTQATLDGTAFAYHCLDHLGGKPPRVDLDLEARLQRALLELCDLLRNVSERRGEAPERSLAALHDVAEGGLAVAVAESALASGIGASVSTAGLPLEGVGQKSGVTPEEGWRRLLAWFSESPSRVICALETPLIEPAKEICSKFGVGLYEIGKTGGQSLSIDGVLLDLETLRDAWKSCISSSLG